MRASVWIGWVPAAAPPWAAAAGALLSIAAAASAVRAGEEAADRARVPAAIKGPVDFLKDVRPILESRCHSCHGAARQRGDLRLDVRSLALEGGSSGPAIVPGDGSGSLIVRCVSGDPPDMLMPKGGDRLSPEEVGILRAWIDRGADWPEALAVEARDPGPEHWSLRVPERPEVPRAAGAADPIDAFILSALAHRGISPAPEADRATLIRRIWFDLTGLPPSPEEVRSFAADTRPEAWAELVDRCLASPRYGERWARHWLDVVRFAESHGFETNTARPSAWPYRDWVIRALNDDLPYDRFVMAQIAGDATGDDEATGFLVAGPWDEVKSPDPALTLQQRQDELHDMVSTTGGAFLGLTVGCARCHDHKFDPISQADYYRLQAVFAGVHHGERPIRPPGAPARDVRAAELRAEIASIDAELGRHEPVARTARVVVLDDEAARNVGAGDARVSLLVPPAATARHAEGTGRGELSDPGLSSGLSNVGRSYTAWRDVPGRDVFAWEPRAAGRFRIWLSWGCGWATHAPDARYVLDLDGDLATRGDQAEIARVDQRRLADGGGEPAGRPLWSGFRDAGVRTLEERSRILLRGGADGAWVAADVLVLEEVAATGGGASGGEEAAAPRAPALRAPVSPRRNVDRFPAVEADRVRFTILASTGAEPCIDEIEVLEGGNPPRNVALAAAGARASASGTLAGFDIHRLEHVNDGLFGNSRSWISSEPGRGFVEIELPSRTLVDRVVWGRDREGRFTDRLAVRYRIEVARGAGGWELVASSDDRGPWTPGEDLPPFVSGEGGDAAALSTLLVRRREREEELGGLTAAPRAYIGRLEEPGPTHRLHRGDPLQEMEAVTPGAPRSIGPPLDLPASAPERERRLALARWIVDPRNPLAARVIANRIWQHHFGRGLVDTPSDFGRNGAPSSHPELLDWLAVELVDGGWSLKALHRRICLSAAYRRSSRKDAASLALDAGSRLLWRFPPRRLEAEPLRDAILAASGKLDLTMGGPGFDLFQPNSNYVKVYEPRREFGPKEWRRMVYQAKPRMRLDDTFGPFDCPDSGQPAPRRNVSTTPLQALGLLNGPFVLEQARFFAARLSEEAGTDPSAQVDRAFWLCFGRAPDAEEEARCVAFIARRGLAQLCRVLFNTNEFLHVF